MPVAGTAVPKVKLAGGMRLERTTPGFGGLYSIQLS
jgi:hypothetical protein